MFLEKKQTKISSQPEEDSVFRLKTWFSLQMYLYFYTIFTIVFLITGDNLDMT